MNASAIKMIFLSFFVVLAACSSSPKKSETPAKSEAPAAAVDGTTSEDTQAITTPEIKILPKHPTEKIVAAKPHSQEAPGAAILPDPGSTPPAHVDTQVAPAAGHAAGGHHELSEGIAPEKALGWLKNGNARFLKGSLRKDGQSKSDIERLSSGQKPHTIILSCSDSRVPPEVLFDQKLGEIFVVRTAGEALDPNAIGSIEYAVEHLGSRLILVMGHTSCGAVKAALGTLGGGDAGSPSLNHLVADLHPRLKAFSGKAPSKDVHDESLANTKGVASDLLGRSEILAKAAKEGRIAVKTALYDLHTGKVDFEE